MHVVNKCICLYDKHIASVKRLVAEDRQSSAVDVLSVYKAAGACTKACVYSGSQRTYVLQKPDGAKS